MPVNQLPHTAASLPYTAAHCRILSHTSTTTAAQYRTLPHIAARTATHLHPPDVYGEYKWIQYIHVF
jgi:hypothetical protein